MDLPLLIIYFCNLLAIIVGQWNPLRTLNFHRLFFLPSFVALFSPSNVGRWSRILQITLHDGPYWGLNAHQMERMRKVRGRGETGCIAEHDNNSTLCTQEKKSVKNVTRCRDGMPKSLQTR